jgi:hypothetical protein
VPVCCSGLTSACSSNDMGDGPAMLKFAGNEKLYALGRGVKTLGTMSSSASARWSVHALGQCPPHFEFSYWCPSVNGDVSIACDEDVTIMNDMVEGLVYITASWLLSNPLPLPAVMSTTATAPFPSTPSALAPYPMFTPSPGARRPRSPPPSNSGKRLKVTGGSDKRMDTLMDDSFMTNACDFGELSTADEGALESLLLEQSGDDEALVDEESDTEVCVVEGPAQDDTPLAVGVIPPVRAGDYLCMTVVYRAKIGMQSVVYVSVRVTQVDDDSNVLAVIPLYNSAQNLLDSGSLPVRSSFMSSDVGGWFIFDHASAALSWDSTPSDSAASRYSRASTAAVVTQYGRSLLKYI